MNEKERFHEICGGFARDFFNDVRELTRSPAPREGVTRLGYSPEEDRAMERIEASGRELGLEIERDPAGNLWMTLPGRDRTLPAVVAGSHADSVLDGGNYDGLAGVAAALCTVKWLRDTGRTPLRDFRVLAIRCEEQGLVGTTAMLGKLRPEDLGRSFVKGGATLAELFAARGMDPAPFMSGRPLIDLSRIAVFLETHIEQSLKLDSSETRRVGLVTGIRGIRCHRSIRAIGETAHAGATEFPYRHDAALACALFVARIYERWQRALAMGDDLVVTTGSIRTPDTAIFNKISGECEMTLDMRSLDDAAFARFSAVIDRTLEEVADETGVRFERDPAVVIAPNHCDERLVGRLADAAGRLGIGVERMASGAGHDAANFGAAGVPFAMLFIANQNGSHNPHEAMKLEDFLAATHVMAETVAAFDE